MPEVQWGNRVIGSSAPCYVVAEIGINHNGSVDTALELVRAAKYAGCDAVKFQKRSPRICVPEDQWDQVRSTPWGQMTYLDYRFRVELDLAAYEQIDALSRELHIDWFASCWDDESLDFVSAFDVPGYKIASACLTDDALLRSTVALGKPILMSTGMSTIEEVRHAADLLRPGAYGLAQSTSAYPCVLSELNLRMIPMYASEFAVPIGYSGHETGLATTVAAVALGASFVERHITLDRSMWGTDQAASVEPQGLSKLVRDIRAVEEAMGDGKKRVYSSELMSMKKLRRA